MHGRDVAMTGATHVRGACRPGQTGQSMKAAFGERRATCRIAERGCPKIRAAAPGVRS